MAASIRVDKGSDVALYRQIAEALRLRFVSGEVGAGERLPGIRLFAEMCGVSASVVQEAYGVLEAEGLTETRGRLGSFVTGKGAGMSRAERVRRLAKGADGLLREGKALGFKGRDVVEIVRARSKKG